MNNSSIYTIPLRREAPFGEFPTNRVFLIVGPKNILIDTGQVSQLPFLKQALESLELDVDDISEVYYTSQSLDSLGNRSAFRNAKHFAATASCDNEKNDILLAKIAPFLDPKIFENLAEFIRVPADDTEIIIIEDGDSITLNEWVFDVVSTGTRSAFLSETFSFVGEISMGEIPPLMPDADDLQRIVSRAQNLATGVVYSTFRDPYENSEWFFKQTQRAFQAFQQSAKLDVPLDEFCKRDLGGIPEDPIFWALYLLKYAPFFLAQNEQVEVEVGKLNN